MSRAAPKPKPAGRGAKGRAPLTTIIRAGKQNPVYAMHGYHLGKKPHDALRRHIEACTRPGELVLDPFAGSGSTALAAVLAGRRAIAADASPAAEWIASFYLRRPDPRGLQRDWRDLLTRAAQDVDPLYATRCHRCDAPARIEYLIYANRYPCPNCAVPRSLYESGGKCPCGGHICTRSPILSYDPVAAAITCLGTCSPRRFVRGLASGPQDRAAFESIDLPHLARVAARPIRHWRPTRAVMDVREGPWGDEWAPSRDVRTIDAFFTPLNLRALAALWHHARGHDDLRAILTAGMLAVSRKAQHLEGGGGYIPGHWALPPVSKQRHVARTMDRVARRVIRAKALLEGTLDPAAARVLRADARDLSMIPTASVDYVLTDPPYGPLVQYAELNCLWEAWLDDPGDWRAREIIVNRSRARTEDDWERGLLEAMQECRRVLKPGRWLSLCYHDTSPARWARVARVMQEAGFKAHPSPGVIDTGGRSYVQHTSDKPTRRELVWHFQSPRRGAVPSPAPARQAFDADAWLTKTLREIKPAPRRADRAYDAVIAAAIAQGVLDRLNLTRAQFQRAWARRRGATRS